MKSACYWLSCKSKRTDLFEGLHNLFDFVDIGIYLQCTMVVADGVIVGDSGSTWQFPAVCTDFSHILVIFLSLCNFVNIFVILISLRIFFLFFWFLLPYLIRVNTYRQFFNIFFFSCWGFQPLIGEHTVGISFL